MNTIGRVVLWVGLLSGSFLGSLGAWGSTPVVFHFSQGSTELSIRSFQNQRCVLDLLMAFSTDRFLSIKGIKVVGVVDTQGSFRTNQNEARERAVVVANFIKQKYSWMFVDSRMPIIVEVRQGASVSRSVEVNFVYPELSDQGDLDAFSLVPLALDTVVGEPGIFILPFSDATVQEQFGQTTPVVAIKTNLLFDLVTAVNLEVEVPLGDRWSLLFAGVFPSWNYNNRYSMRILETSIEGRFWFPKPAERLMGHFVGVYGHWVVDYDLQWERKGVMGSGYGFGVTYGYAHSIGRHFGLEYSLGVGGIYLQNKSYGVTPDYDYKHTPVTTSGWHILPTRLKVSLVWRIGGKKAIRK